jgi:formate hydrogenlyase subunit 3/multisubunit Na+/H+ antiporter MnhD subunit
MSAPILWIVFPLALSVMLLFFLQYPRLIKTIGILASLVLALIAIIQPIGNVLHIGSLVLDISPTFLIFGRSLVLEDADRFALSLVYTSLFLFLIAMDTKNTPAKFVPLAMAISSVLVSALAVRPFLYAAVLMEMAVLLIILMVREKQDQPVNGIIRFLIYLTLAMPSILFAGWLLGSSQAAVTIEAKMVSALVFLLFGFMIWLAVFPFHSWLPQFSRAVDPYMFSFIFSIIPVITLLVIMKYISSLLWLRSSSYLSPALATVGVIMIVTTGMFASVEKELKRFLAYTVLFETGFALTLLSLRSAAGVQLLYESFIPRIFSLALLGFSLKVLFSQGVNLTTDGMRGLIRRMPLATIGALVSLLSILGMPIFASFPFRLEAMNLLSLASRDNVLWIIAGVIGMLIGTIRIFVQAAQPTGEKWEINEKISQVLIIGFGIVLLIVMGLFPAMTSDLVAPFIAEIPVLW